MGITAIFGGTFNPFHIGHYEMLKALQNDDDIDEIWIMPDKIPPHKSTDFLAKDSVRIEMCKIVSEDFSKASVCLTEFEREGKSYTYDTVIRLKDEYPEKDFSFVMGGDMFVYFEKWYKYDELLKLLSFTVFRRTDTNDEEFDECYNKFSELGMKIKIKTEKIPHASSTVIRNNFSTAKNLLPEKIYKFLAERGEYNE